MRKDYIKGEVHASPFFCCSEKKLRKWMQPRGEITSSRESPFGGEDLADGVEGGDKTVLVSCHFGNRVLPDLEMDILLTRKLPEAYTLMLTI